MPKSTHGHMPMQPGYTKPTVAEVHAKRVATIRSRNAPMTEPEYVLLRLLHEAYARIECFDRADHEAGNCLDCRILDVLKAYGE